MGKTSCIKCREPALGTLLVCYDHAVLCTSCDEEPSEAGTCPACQDAQDKDKQERINIILLVPPKDGFDELFGHPFSEIRSRLGLRLPMMLEWQCPKCCVTWWCEANSTDPQGFHAHSISTSRSGCRSGLVLAWGREPVKMSIARLWEMDPDNVSPSALVGSIKCALEGDALPRAVTSKGSLVFLDSDFNEVKHG